MQKLIYFTLGNNLNYLKLANLCVKSLYINQYDGDLLFITDIKEEILNNIFFKKPPYFLEVKNSNLIHSSANKLKIYKYENILSYDKIIFSDLDILWLKNPNIIFNIINEDKFYFSNENSLMTQEYWGGKIFTNEEKLEINKQNILGINAGIFGFNKTMINTLEKIDEFFDDNLDLINECLEQPFVNVYLQRKKLYNTELNNYVSHNGYNLINYGGVVLHFAGGPGNYEMKYKKMDNYFRQKYGNY